MCGGETPTCFKELRNNDYLHIAIILPHKQSVKYLHFQYDLLPKTKKLKVAPNQRIRGHSFMKPVKS